MNYAQQIKHPNWQKKRLEVLEHFNFECQECGSKEEQLHVHHPFYKRGAMIWQYEVGDLECLCHKCHKDAHTVDEEFKKLLSITPVFQKKVVFGFLKSMHRSRKEQPKDNSENIGFTLGIGYLCALGETTNA